MLPDRFEGENYLRTIDTFYLYFVHIDKYTLHYQYNVDEGKCREKMRISNLCNQNITTFWTVNYSTLFEISTLH